MADDLATALMTKIVAAYLKSNTLPTGDIPDLIRATYAALTGTASSGLEPVAHHEPAVPVKKSVTPDAIFCLECGRGHKTLRRHLGTAHGLTVDEYRTKWSLPREYPVVSPKYAEQRSQMAVGIGLGRKRK